MFSEPANRGVLDSDAAFRPVEVEIPSPARALAMEPEQTPERRILGREAAGGMAGEDAVVL